MAAMNSFELGILHALSQKEMVTLREEELAETR